jgi:para-nitrobenzyl esterase
MLVRIIAAAAAVGFFCLLSACGQKPAPPEPDPVIDPATRVSLSEGEAVGFKNAEGVHVWRGLPFAAPPKGPLRWRAPRPPEPWEGMRKALAWSERCPQITNVFSVGEGFEEGALIGDEDCLYLNVYAPATARAGAEPLPVMVWVHGGGNVWGAARQYDPSRLVANENVIVVTVQYRLGPLGWFALDAIRGAAETPEDASANFGTLDIVQSLDWVKRNIAAFGGDPARVTVFGESAGGHNVATLLAAPQAKGLFHRAIIQSGLFDSTPVATAENGESEINAASKTAQRAGAASAEALRALSVKALYDAYELDESGYLNLPLVIEDGVVVPEKGLRAAMSDRALLSPVPVITGTNRDEMKLFQLVDPRLVNRYFKVILVAKDQRFYDALSHYQSRLWRIRSVDEPAAAMLAAGHLDVYGYRFDWDEGGSFLLTDLKKLLGAAHAIEIPFVFNRFKLLGPMDALMFTRKSEPARDDLSRDMGGYWAEFARTGAPSTGGARANAEWPRWRTGGGSLLRLDEGAGGFDILTGPDSIDALIVDLGADPRLTTEQRKIIADALSMWLPSRKDDFAAAAAN